MCEQISFGDFDNLNFKKMSTEEKFNYFEKQKDILNHELTDICKSVAQNYGLKYLAFSIESSKLDIGKPENHKHSVSVSLGSSFGARVYLQTKIYRIEYRKKLHEYIKLPSGVNTREMKSFPDSIVIDFENKSDLFFECCKIVLEQALIHYEPTDYFGCCGKYIQCSDAKKCLHEDLFYAKACYYKRNLEAGKIFYGKNANV